VLIDSVLPLPDPGLDLAQEVRRRFAGFAEYVERVYGSPLILPYDELARLDDVGQIDLLIKILRETVDLPAAVLEHQRDSYLDLRSGERHSPVSYSGRTLLYRATEPAPHTVRDARYERDDDALGWDLLCPDLAVHRVPGHHLSLLDPPAVDELARLLDADLRGVPAAPRP
jgi:polyketide synthase 13